MRNRTETIRRIVSYLNNPDEGGGFWLPNIQRHFVWDEGQICRLFDSILREYPISTFLIWKTLSPIRRRKFIDNWGSAIKVSNFYVPEDKKRKCLVLDGQQRLQSLFIGLCGSFLGKELYFDVLSGAAAALPDDIKFRFKFYSAVEAKFPWIKFKDLVFATQSKRELSQNIKAHAQRELTEKEKDQIQDNLDLIDRTFNAESAITYQELDSIDSPTLYTEDDVVEIFIRANSGGTKLEKSDLLFSLLNAAWDVADDRMEALLEQLNRHGFAFDRDFVLKTCLVLLNQGAQYQVEKFRRPGVREAIESQWNKLSASIQAVVDFIRGKTYIQCDKALPSYLALIPLIYIYYHFPAAWNKAQNIDTFLIRTLLAGAFGGQSDRVIDNLVNRFKELERFDEQEGYAVIRNLGRSLEITPQRFFDTGYGSKNLHLILNLWYPTFSHVPAYDGNLPQVDHIFPQSLLKTIRVQNPDTGRFVMKYRDEMRNQLANCMLLTRAENGAGGKGDAVPSDWFSDKDDAYLDLHLIPKDRALWAQDRYEDFIVERRKLIANKFHWLLTDGVVP